MFPFNFLPHLCIFLVTPTVWTRRSRVFRQCSVAVRFAGPDWNLKGIHSNKIPFLLLRYFRCLWLHPFIRYRLTNFSSGHFWLESLTDINETPLFFPIPQFFYYLLLSKLQPQLSLAFYKVWKNAFTCILSKCYSWWLQNPRQVLTREFPQRQRHQTYDSPPYTLLRWGWTSCLCSFASHPHSIFFLIFSFFP